MDVSKRLEYLRGEINAERISYSEIAELQSLAAFIDPSDVQLLEWAGIPESSGGEDDLPNRVRTWQCEDCRWPWPRAGKPPEYAECDNCGGELTESDG